MKKRRHVLRWITIPLAALLLASPALSVSPANAAYTSPWSRADAYWYAITGLHEPYAYGGAWWNANGIPEPWLGEGADCSGFASKAWAVDGWTWPDQYYRVYSTQDFYYGTVDGAYEVSWFDGSNLFMTVFVHDVLSGNNRGHMGLMFTDNGNGGVETIEATGSSIDWNNKATGAYLFAMAAKKIQRVTFTYP